MSPAPTRTVDSDVATGDDVAASVGLGSSVTGGGDPEGTAVLAGPSPVGWAPEQAATRSANATAASTRCPPTAPPECRVIGLRLQPQPAGRRGSGADAPANAEGIDLAGRRRGGEADRFDLHDGGVPERRAVGQPDRLGPDARGRAARIHVREFDADGSGVGPGRDLDVGHRQLDRKDPGRAAKWVGELGPLLAGTVAPLGADELVLDDEGRFGRSERGREGGPPADDLAVG